VLDASSQLVAGLQANLESGARRQLVFGRNEPGLQHRHITWEQALQKADASAG
jgi:carnitine monooxygenase subunit